MNASLRKLPDYTQLDLFQADYNDIAIRSLREVMERPFFALTNNRPRFKSIRYQTKDAEVIISGGEPYGIATIFDHDILMWLISRIVEAKDSGKPTSPQTFFYPSQCLQGIYRRTGGTEYQSLSKSIQRLANTHISTTIRKEDQIPLSKKEKHRLKVGFHWLESYGIQTVEQKGKETVKGITAVIPNWLYKGALKHGNVLTIDERYFAMTSGLERVLYMIARKHCGNQRDGFHISMKRLYEKTGSDSPFKDFASRVRKIIIRDPLPEYTMSIYKGQYGDEIVLFYKRSYLDFADYRYEGERMSKGRKAVSMEETSDPQYTNEQHRVFLGESRKHKKG